MIRIRLGRRAGVARLHEFTYDDFVRGIAQVLAKSKARRSRCRVHAMHKAWAALWPIVGLAAQINLANNDPVTVCGWQIEFDWDFPQGEAEFA